MVMDPPPPDASGDGGSYLRALLSGAGSGLGNMWSVIAGSAPAAAPQPFMMPPNVPGQVARYGEAPAESVARVAQGAYDLTPMAAVNSAITLRDQAADQAQQGNWANALKAGGGALLSAIGAVPGAGPEARAASEAATPLLGLAKAGARGLDMSEAARMQRAAEQGFGPLEFYHATNADINRFQLNKVGSGSNPSGKAERAIWMTDKPGVASEYVRGPYYRDGDKVAESFASGGNVMPLRVRGVDDFDGWDMGGAGYNASFVQDALKQARADKLKGVMFHNMRDPSYFTAGQGQNSHILAVFDTKDVRSRFAAFDPARAKSSDILAGLGAGGVGLAAIGADGAASQ